MIEQIKKNWKVIVICVLIAIIVFLLYKRRKVEDFEEIQEAVEVKPSQNATGNIGQTSDNQQDDIFKKVDLLQIFSDYRSGKIDRATAIKESGLSNGSFYRRLNKYDNGKTDAI